MALKTLYKDGKPLTLGGKTLKVNDQGLPEQEENVSITGNGTTEVVPDTGKTLSKITIVVDVPTSGGAETDYFKQRLAGSMTQYTDDTSQSIGDYAFYGQKQLAEVSMSAAKYVGAFAFYNCNKLATLDMPAIVDLKTNAFRACTSLTEFVTGSSFNSRIDTSTFEGCSALVKADFYHITTSGISNYGLACANLETLIIRNTDAVPPLGVNGFGAATTKLNAGTGYIYVPAAMVDAYKAATNWAKYADQIRAIEDYPAITGG